MPPPGACIYSLLTNQRRARANDELEEQKKYVTARLLPGELLAWYLKAQAPVFLTHMK